MPGPGPTPGVPAALASHGLLVEARLRRSARATKGLLGTMARYHMAWADPRGRPVSASSGKLLRPALCLWACQVAGGTAEQALDAAAAVEWLHNFTLIHDDIQDGDTQRRHRPTVWSVFGPAQAINAGDGLFALGLLHLLGAGPQGGRRRRAAAVLSRAILEVIEGQCLDLGLQGRPDTSPRTYLKLAGAKTGALIGASLEAGAVMAGAKADLRGSLRRAGRRLGAAFQIRDDWLGTWGDPSRTGKSAGSDLADRKTTYPVVAAYAVASPSQRRRLRALFKDPDPGCETLIRSLLVELGGPQLTADKPQQLAEAGRAELAGRLAPRRLQEYDQIASYLIRRDR